MNDQDLDITETDFNTDDVITSYSIHYTKLYDTVVVPAAGVGRRMGADCPKQFV